MLLISDILLAFLASSIYPLIEIKAIAQSIIKIATTITNSTNVKALPPPLILALLCDFCIFLFREFIIYLFKI
ncbi:MAG: hypothetical protein LBQ24_02355 [Candidatus Peribacteria bacterium]|jgi:hypothetical protein|nr:hypothetical protein [Candidatus Peribacteria bacterium]